MSEKNQFPVLPLRDVVVYPQMVIPLFVGRTRSIRAIEVAMEDGQQIFLVAQKDSSEASPQISDLYEVGCLANILQMLKLPDGSMKVLVEGLEARRAKRYFEADDHLLAEIEPFIVKEIDEREAEVLSRSLFTQFEQYVKLSKKIPAEILTTFSAIRNPLRLVDTIAAHMTLRITDKQKILETPNLAERIEKLMGMIEAEIDVLQVEKRVRGRVKRQMEKTQREYFLNEQMKAIQEELGDKTTLGELDELAKKIEAIGMPKEAKDKALSELNKLKMMSPMSAEATVSRNYLDWMVTVPWNQESEVNSDLSKAEESLREDHYGLEKVKEHVIEHLAVQTRVKKLKGPILCLVGPPGVGKTSLGQSIARATGRKFVRISLGGVRDEAEIRGHRRTYIGSLPGKIIQKLAKIGVRNPLFLLDEVDKMAMDFRGDPASALLEVLDPEQNNTFNDHYLEVDFDLSDVMFVATANTLNIPPALLDRMEVIRLEGYTEDEKLHIALEHLVPKQIELNGLKEGELTIEPEVIRDIIRYYTREAGVRNLERAISKICRKVVKTLLGKKRQRPQKVTPKTLEKYLGVRRYRYGKAEEKSQIGQVTGLAWTEVGGELLTIEAAAVPGKGKSIYTGHLGDVMQESIQTAMTVVRSRANLLGIKRDFYEKLDIHIHVPEGATPKDGPSAGIGMCTAIVSVLTGIPVRPDVAMTGEITLRGEVLPIGGLKEKLLGAHRGGIKTVVIPQENEKDLKEIPDNIKKDLKIHTVRWIDQVLHLALERYPKAIREDLIPSLPMTTSLGEGQQGRRAH